MRAGLTAERNGEKGAAMVMALMISFLLLAASAGLLLESSLNTQNVSDITAEQEAYNAAESGIQSAVNVLRGNVVPSPLIDSTKPATDDANKINFVKALRLSTSDVNGDASSSARLSRWLTYDGTCNDRVILGSSGCTMTGTYGFSVTISDPDNTGTQVSYTTTGRFFDSDSTDITQRTYGSGGNTLIVKYTGTTQTNLDVSAGPTNTNFGKFTLTINGTGASIPAFNRFEIQIHMTKPYNETRVIRGYVETNSSGPPKIIFDAQTFTLQGSVMTLNFAWGLPTNVSVMGPPQRYGYEATMSTGDDVITGTMTSPEPVRVLVRSTGYGPRGAMKKLEAIVQKDSFNDLSAPATLTLVGPTSTSSPASSFLFNPGSSNVTVYSGDDVASTDIIPPIGVMNPTNLNTVEDSVSGQPPHPFNGTVIGSPSDVSPETPDWLANPAALDTTIKGLANVAQSSGGFFPSGTAPTSWGNNAAGTGITFCDGNCSLSGNGGGILVVTGTLTLSGSLNFNGMIIVTGQGGITRSGGGNATIQGNIVVAPYVGSRMQDSIDPASTDTFLSPQYDLSGGGNSTVVYNSKTLANSMLAVSNYVLGVAEK
ncbi:MAG: hypothetical protein ACJ73D_08310 [Pyrinomonadaceae bacterium]